MERVTGIGGVFFKTRDPAATIRWYEHHLGIEVGTGEGEGGFSVFPWRERAQPDRTACTVWSPFREDTRYFDPSGASFMINYRVRNLDAMLGQLRDAGIEIVGEPENHPNGRFAWILDPDGRKIELWEPAAGH